VEGKREDIIQKKTTEKRICLSLVNGQPNTHPNDSGRKTNLQTIHSQGQRDMGTQRGKRGVEKGRLGKRKKSRVEVYGSISMENREGVQSRHLITTRC